MSILKHISNIEGVTTAHGVGIKQILLGSEDTDSAVTQIAVTTIEAGEEVKPHMHISMDEHYFILNGKGVATIEKEQHPIIDGTYLLVTAGVDHSLRAFTKLKMITIGIAYDK